MKTSTDRIEKRIQLRAPLARVWRAITDASEFGAWFGVKFDRPFVAGVLLRGTITPTKVDATVAASQKPYEGAAFEIVIERIEPMRLFSFRWHPFAVDAKADYSREPMTLVEFELRETSGGTLLTLSESGFDALPPERRAKAFEMNDSGWTAQATLIAKYVDDAA
jgi:uncharacterized protein YndB with AHSA1/START domain